VKKYILRRIKENQLGVAIIEFALIIPILLILVMGTIEFGYIFNGYIILTGAAREGARVAVVGKVDEIDDKVKSHMEGSYVTGVSTGYELGDKGEETVVTVTGNISNLTGFFNFLGSPFTLSAEATMRQQVDPPPPE